MILLWKYNVLAIRLFFVFIEYFLYFQIIISEILFFFLIYDKIKVHLIFHRWHYHRL